ncbi:hypothetical protein HFO71_24260 [Rhizobium laguerreae]|uniref:hypothetical protein n=1 Tax=Rhizobium laguerreae TaxID=1076926 RepID=UPI001C911E0D|nr:hypothetical protein [Rhizobium laguerreae]MBY3073431.1 hypothetical protein [Rhizobium laguerreae]
MKTLLPCLLGFAAMAFGHFVLGFPWETCLLVMALGAIVILSNEIQDLRSEIAFIRSILDDRDIL